jgi:hypothetical protein
MAGTISADVEKQLPLEKEPPSELNTDAKEPSPVSTGRSSLEQAVQIDPPKAASPWADPSSFPDGGGQAWLTVAAASACFFVSWGYVALRSDIVCLPSANLRLGGLIASECFKRDI